MVCIVAYDIEKNRIRAKLARLLLGKGNRIQKSVFAIEIERHEFNKFLKQIKNLVEEKDQVAVFRLCKGCQNNAVQLHKDEKMYIF